MNEILASASLSAAPPPDPMSTREPDFAAARSVYERILENIERVIHGQRVAVRKLLAVFAAGGHALLEDVPGTGKTTLAKALAQSIHGSFRRIQFTPDLLPSDVLGVSVFNQQRQEFEFHEGPVFSNILLADEINRASPRTQSALLESMGERQVSVDGDTLMLPELFFVIATQNPIEFRGTYPLPEAQMDRFAIQFGLGYVSLEDEIAILSSQGNQHPIDDLQAVCELEDAVAMRQAVAQVRVSPEIQRYIVELVRATREHDGIELGASPRASLTLRRIAQAIALFEGQSFVTPDHVRDLAPEVIRHRLVIEQQAKYSGLDEDMVVRAALESTPSPA